MGDVRTGRGTRHRGCRSKERQQAGSPHPSGKDFGKGVAGRDARPTGGLGDQFQRQPLPPSLPAQPAAGGAPRQYAQVRAVTL